MNGYFLFFLLSLFFLNCVKPDSAVFHVMVRAGYSGAAGAILDGIPTFASIGIALSKVPEENDKPFIIFIRKGRYYEKLSVDKSHVHFLGESREKTIITYDASGGTPDPAVNTGLSDPLAKNTRVPGIYLRLGFRVQERGWFGQDGCLAYRLEGSDWDNNLVTIIRIENDSDSP